MILDRTSRRAGRTSIVLLTFAALSSAAPIVIDDFASDHLLNLAAGLGNPKNAANSGSGGIGGDREFTLTRTAGTGSATLDSNVNSPGLLTYQTGISSNAQFLLVWDGSGDTTPSAAADLGAITNLAFGLGGIDLTDGNTNQFFRISADADNNGNVPLVLRIYSSATKYIEASTTIIGGVGFGTYDIPFSSFVGFGLGGDTTLDVIKSANAIALFGDPPQASDVSIDFIQAGTEVPEPTTLALIGSAIVVFGFVRRRLS